MKDEERQEKDRKDEVKGILRKRRRKEEKTRTEEQRTGYMQVQSVHFLLLSFLFPLFLYIMLVFLAASVNEA